MNDPNDPRNQVLTPIPYARVTCRSSWHIEHSAGSTAHEPSGRWNRGFIYISRTRGNPREATISPDFYSAACPLGRGGKTCRKSCSSQEGMSLGGKGGPRGESARVLALACGVSTCLIILVVCQPVDDEMA